MRNLVTAIVIVLACVAGLWLASVDARTDDTGIEASLIFLIAAALSAVRPRAAVLIALIVGTPIPIVEAMRASGLPGGIAALAAVRPRGAIVIAFIVGAPIPIAEALRTGTFPAGIVALGFSVAGALVGAYLGIIARRSASSSSA